MSFLPKLSRFFLEAGAVADREALPGLKALTVSERDFSVTTHVDKEQNAATIQYFLYVFVISLFLFTFLGCMIARRNNPRLPNNNGNIEGEQQQMLIRNAQNQFEIEAANGTTDVHHDQAHRRDCSSTFERKCTLGTQIALVNFILEIPQAVMDQIASENKHSYVLIVMLISFTSMLVCFVELVCRGRKEKITWRCSSNGGIPWFYHPPPASNRPFGTLMEMIGLACAVAQSIVTTINYSLYLRNHAAPVKISVMPMIFGFGMFCSKLMKKTEEDEGEIRTDQPLTPAQLLQ